MYTVTVSATFEASHDVQFPDGAREPVHSHDWVVEARFTGSELDASGMLVDFTEAQRKLRAITDSLAGTNLNDWPALCGLCATAERVAQAVFDVLAREACLGGHLSGVQVTEAPGCRAGYVPGQSPSGLIETGSG